MELRITNPQENWLTEQILWNNEELKAAIAEKVKDYKTIAYTEDSLTVSYTHLTLPTIRLV